MHHCVTWSWGQQKGPELLISVPWKPEEPSVVGDEQELDCPTRKTMANLASDELAATFAARHDTRLARRRYDG